MPLPKSDYEKALQRSLTDEQYRQLIAKQTAGGPQSRDPSAYDDARQLKLDKAGAPIKAAPEYSPGVPIRPLLADPDKGGELVPGEQTKALTAYSPKQVDEWAAKYPGMLHQPDVDRARAELGGPLYAQRPTPIDKPDPSKVVEVPVDMGGKIMASSDEDIYRMAAGQAIEYDSAQEAMEQRRQELLNRQAAQAVGAMGKAKPHEWEFTDDESKGPSLAERLYSDWKAARAKGKK
jgi:hypothetical protein